MTKTVTVRDNEQGPRRHEGHLQLASRCGRLPPLPMLHWLRVAPQPMLRSPRFLQIPQHRLPAPVLLIPPCQPSANKFLVQVPPSRQDDLGGGAFAPINVADFHRHRLSESQIPGELLGACRMAASSRGPSFHQSWLRSDAPLCLIPVMATTLPAKSSA